MSQSIVTAFNARVFKIVQEIIRDKNPAQQVLKSEEKFHTIPGYSTYRSDRIKG